MCRDHNYEKINNVPLQTAPSENLSNNLKAHHIFCKVSYNWPGILKQGVFLPNFFFLQNEAKWMESRTTYNWFAPAQCEAVEKDFVA